MPGSNTLLEELAISLNGLEGVFSTPQWGGRAYKVHVGPAGQFKLLAHVTTGGRTISVGFKLPPERARDVVEQYDWIEPSSFRTLAPAGWVSAEFTTKRQLAVLKKLLAESRRLYRSTPRAEPESAGPSNSVVRRIDEVMKGAKAEGWKPASDW